MCLHAGKEGCNFRVILEANDNNWSKEDRLGHNLSMEQVEV